MSRHIQCLEIVNFQSWKYCLLEFSPGVNIIVGSSDQGKSSIIRSLNWVCENRPTGNSFRSNFTKKPTEVTLGIEDQTIRREKGKKNIYNLNGASATEDLQALRSDIPDEIKNITKMGSVNIQPQNENYFLLNDTPGQVAKRFNEIAGLEIMDKSLQSINSKIKSLNQDVKATDKSLESFEEKIKNLDWIKSCEENLIPLEKQEIELQKLENRISEYKTVLVKFWEIMAEVKKLPPPEILPFVEDILDLDDNLYETEEKLDVVEKLLERHSKLDKELKQYLVLKNAKLSSPQSLRSILGRIDEKIELISNLIERFKNNLTNLVIIKAKIKQAKNDLADFEKKIKICPTCHKPWR